MKASDRSRLLYFVARASCPVVWFDLFGGSALALCYLFVCIINAVHIAKYYANTSGRYSYTREITLYSVYFFILTFACQLIERMQVDERNIFALYDMFYLSLACKIAIGLSLVSVVILIVGIGSERLRVYIGQLIKDRKRCKELKRHDEPESDPEPR